MSSLPTLAVIGLGSYFKKLKSHLRQRFDPVVLLDTHEGAIGIEDATDRRLFQFIVEGADLEPLVADADVVLVLTPHDSHAKYAVDLLAIGKRVILEKPIGVALSEIDRLRHVVHAQTPIYFSDFYVDVRAAPLQWYLGCLPAPQEWIADRLGIVRDLPPLSELGDVSRIDAAVLEKYTAPEWYRRAASYGGAVLDMLVHPLALVKCIRPTDDLSVHRIGLDFGDGWEVERGARLEGTLLDDGIPILLRVQKEARRFLRYFLVEMGAGSRLRQAFTKTAHPLRISHGGHTWEVGLRGNRYGLAVEAMARWVTKGGKRYGWEWSSWAAEQCCRIRRVSEEAPQPEALSAAEYRADQEQTRDLSRRHFLISTGASGLSAVTSILLACWGRYPSPPNHAGSSPTLRQARSRCHSALERASMRLRDDPRLDVSILQRLTSALSVSRTAFLSPGRIHGYGSPSREARMAGFPHDLEALAVLRLTFPGPVEEFSGVDYSIVPRGATVAATGSPSSGHIAMTVMPSWKLSGHRAEMTDPGRVPSLPYNIAADEADRRVRVYSGMQRQPGVEQRPVDKAVKALISESGELILSDYDNLDSQGWLTRDFLLLTRLPIEEDVDLFLISGGHGAGTQAFQLAVMNKKLAGEDLETLESIVGGQPYYQVVFEIDEIQHRAPMSVAHEIRLSHAAPPMVLEDTA